MTPLLIALLLQVPIALPARAQLENPASVSPVPQKAQKDYDKLWKRFLSGKEDTKVASDLDRFFKKHPEALSGLIVHAYIDLYAGRIMESERRFHQVLARQSMDPVALFYLGELAYARGDFVTANDFFTRLQARRPAPEVEMKRQRALLLAMDTLWQGARRAAADNQLPEAERLYRQALHLAPREAALHGQLGDVLQRAGKRDEAEAEFRLQREYSGSPTLVASDHELTVKGLEELGRWGNQIERFREIQLSKAITREQLSALLTGYFPELTDFRQSTEIITDIQSSWARNAIETVVAAGILDRTANHAFQPARTATRGEFAQALARLMRLLRVSPATLAPIAPLDVVSGSTLYLELQPVLGYGLLSLDKAGNFNVAAQVSGEEAVSTAEKLHGLIHKKTP
ncbi:MAG TPA: tetratricopeptide repeat protein [Terriglobia bacterium]|nr:tetratricopeptide repeat protein [Terriglobia bacterium]